MAVTDAVVGVLAALGRRMTDLVGGGPEASLLQAYRDASLVIGREVCVFEESAAPAEADRSPPSPVLRGTVRAHPRPISR